MNQNKISYGLEIALFGLSLWLDLPMCLWYCEVHIPFCVAGRHDSPDRWQSYPWLRWPWSSGNWNTYWKTWYVCCCCRYQPTESMSTISECVSLCACPLPFVEVVSLLLLTLFKPMFISDRYSRLCSMLVLIIKSYLKILFVSNNIYIKFCPCLTYQKKICSANYI
jgi:hypothetical protein